MSSLRRLAVIAASVMAITALVASPSNAQVQSPETQVFANAMVAKSSTSVVKQASHAAVKVVAYAQPGEGVIRIMERVCGSAAQWQKVASANNIVPPVYLVLLGQRIEVDCSTRPGTPAPAQAQAQADPAPAPVAPANNGWAAPLPGYGNGNCNFWEWRGSYNHRGEDLVAPAGTPIHAVGAGTVWTGWDGGAGNYTMITHSNGAVSVYMHQSSFAIRSGWVEAGQVIGYVGSTGNSTGPHLHFEIQPWGAWNGVVNPIQYLVDRGVSLYC